MNTCLCLIFNYYSIVVLDEITDPSSLIVTRVLTFVI